MHTEHSAPKRVVSFFAGQPTEYAHETIMTTTFPVEANDVGTRRPATTAPAIPERATFDVVVNGTQKSTVAIVIDVWTRCSLGVYLCKPS
jgi:hypothetical protein